jgi:hypothetical protein
MIKTVFIHEDSSRQNEGPLPYPTHKQQIKARVSVGLSLVQNSFLTPTGHDVNVRHIPTF